MPSSLQRQQAEILINCLAMELINFACKFLDDYTTFTHFEKFHKKLFVTRSSVALSRQGL